MFSYVGDLVTDSVESVFYVWDSRPSTTFSSLLFQGYDLTFLHRSSGLTKGSYWGVQHSGSISQCLYKSEQDTLCIVTNSSTICVLTANIYISNSHRGSIVLWWIMWNIHSLLSCHNKGKVEELGMWIPLSLLQLLWILYIYIFIHTHI